MRCLPKKVSTSLASYTVVAGDAEILREDANVGSCKSLVRFSALIAAESNCSLFLTSGCVVSCADVVGISCRSCLF